MDTQGTTHTSNPDTWERKTVMIRRYVRLNQAPTTIELLTDISLSERARLVHPWPLRSPSWKSPPFITCRTFPVVLCFLHFSWHFRFFFPFFFRFVCGRVLGARHGGRARHRRGCQRVTADRGGVKRSAVAVFVPRRLVSLETRGKHEWALSGLHL